jgi:hypothetical protein
LIRRQKTTESQTSSCDGNTTTHTQPNPSLPQVLSSLQSHQNAALLRTETSLNENQREIKRRQENIEKKMLSLQVGGDQN